MMDPCCAFTRTRRDFRYTPGDARIRGKVNKTANSDRTGSGDLLQRAGGETKPTATTTTAIRMAATHNRDRGVVAIVVAVVVLLWSTPLTMR